MSSRDRVVLSPVEQLLQGVGAGRVEKPTDADRMSSTAHTSAGTTEESRLRASDTVKGRREIKTFSAPIAGVSP
jgi:hypothetical protein